MIDFEVEPQPFGSILALVGNKLPLNNFAELLLSELSDLRTLLWWADYSFKLAHVLHPRDGHIFEV